MRAAGGHELFVVAALDHAAFFHQQDRVGATDRGKAMGDHESSAAREQRGHGGLDELFALGVEVARGFVEDQELRRGENRARSRGAGADRRRVSRRVRR